MVRLLHAPLEIILQITPFPNNLLDFSFVTLLESLKFLSVIIQRLLNQFVVFIFALLVHGLDLRQLHGHFEVVLESIGGLLSQHIFHLYCQFLTEVLQLGVRGIKGALQFLRFLLVGCLHLTFQLL